MSVNKRIALFTIAAGLFTTGLYFHSERTFYYLFVAGKPQIQLWYPHAGGVLYYLLKTYLPVQVILLFIACASLFSFRNLYIGYIMMAGKAVKLFLTEFLPYIIALFVTFSVMEIISFTVLTLIGISPLENRYIYSREINGYYVNQGMPGFNQPVLDGLNHFKPSNERIDENGFICDEKVFREKPSGVTRIFITGGSTALGKMENIDITRDTTYPHSQYSYNSSIAGILKSDLSAMFPGKKFEVVNAAVVGHVFHQGYLMYLTKLHEFNPDIIVNIDGFNEAGSMVSKANGYFDYCEHSIEDYLDLEFSRRQRRWPFTLYLANYVLDKIRHERTANSLEGDYSNPSTEYYLNHAKPELIEKSKSFLWAIESYENQLKRDKVLSVFCIQGMLDRISPQKKLSPLEKKLKTNCFGQSAENYYSKTDIVPEFWDDYLALKVDSLITANGAAFIDVSQNIAGLDSTQEFYMDYCHLTPLGNKIVAGLIADKIQIFMQNSAHPE